MRLTKKQSLRLTWLTFILSVVLFAIVVLMFLN